MKVCEHCGGILYRHSEARNGSQRYICKECRKTMTVRNGQASILKGRPMKQDWRHV